MKFFGRRNKISDREAQKLYKQLIKHGISKNAADQVINFYQGEKNNDNKKHIHMPPLRLRST